MKNIYIYGASGHGKVVYELAILNGYKVLGFIDDKLCDKLFGLDVINFDEFLKTFAQKKSAVAIGIGNNHHRQKIYEKLKNLKVKTPSLVHPRAVVSSLASLDEACVVMAGAVINPDAKILKGVIVNTSASIDHDCIVQDFCHIAPNAVLAGGVNVGKSSFIGAGACVKECIKITQKTIIGAGSVVVKDLLISKTYKGNPAK